MGRTCAPSLWDRLTSLSSGPQFHVPFCGSMCSQGKSRRNHPVPSFRVSSGGSSAGPRRTQPLKLRKVAWAEPCASAWPPGLASNPPTPASMNRIGRKTEKRDSPVHLHPLLNLVRIPVRSLLNELLHVPGMSLLLATWPRAPRNPGRPSPYHGSRLTTPPLGINLYRQPRPLAVRRGFG